MLDVFSYRIRRKSLANGAERGLPRCFPWAGSRLPDVRHLRILNTSNAEPIISVETVAYRLGGPKILRRKIETELDLANAVREGLPSEALDYVLDAVREWAGPQAAVLDIVGSRRTLERKTGGRKTFLKSSESDRLARLARMIVRAEDAIGNADKAHRWLMKPNRALGGLVPLTLLDSDAGASAVEQVLGRIEYGVYG